MSALIRIVVLDDDPTGIQTVHGNLLFTRWDLEALRHGFEDDCPFFYVLTNTRAFTRDRARETVAEIVANVLALNRDFGYRLIFVSRSDSFFNDTATT
ncbi:MAG: four-carbon acid sugar kinase family protein, partial [Planctomycetes bacterium]|nr:four-carbon acid sugar kinase family protein [Planctomycetota bacterium]